jgi:hypothetical protein
MATTVVTQGIKVNAGINVVSANTTGLAVTVYTAPANGYAIVQFDLKNNSGTTQTITASIGSMQLATISLTTGALASATFANLPSLRGIYVGPGVSITLPASNNMQAYVTGVEFINF